MDEQIIKDLQGAIEQMKALGGMDQKVKEYSDKLETLEKSVTEMKQKTAAFNVSGVSEEFGIAPEDARKFNAAALLKSLHAHAIAQTAGVNVEKVAGYNGRERELAEQMRTKAAEFGNDGSGGLFVPSDIMADFVDTLRPSDRILLDAGARMVNLPSGTGTLSLPRKLSNSVAYDLAENGVPTPSDLGWEMRNLTPHRTSATSSVSNRLTFSVPGYVNILRDDLIKTVLLRMQFAALYGTGNSGAPLGLKNDPKAATYAADGAGSAGKTVRYTDVADFEDVLMELDASLEGSVLITHPRVIRNMKIERVKQFSGQTTGSPVLQFNTPRLDNAALEKAVGYGIKSYTAIPVNQTVGGDTDCADIFFGRADELSMYTWGGVAFKMSKEATVNGLSAFSANLLHIQADVEYDILWRQPKQMLVVTGCKTTRLVSDA